VAKRVERRKKSNGTLECPRIRGKQQRGEGKQRALGKEKAAAAINLDKVKGSAPESTCGYMERNRISLHPSREEDEGKQNSHRSAWA
jgi:hypothetical protein